MWAAPYSYPEVISPLQPNGNVGHLWWVSGTGWNTFKDLGGSMLSHVSTITWPDTHAELFALGSDGTIWHDYFVFASSDWSGWTSMGGSNLVTGAAPIRWSDGHVELFATDAQGAVWHDWSGNFTGGWHGWDKIGGAIASRPVPVRWADGHVEVFATGKDGHLYHSDWANSAWPDFSVIDAATTIVGEPSAIMNPKGGGGAVGPEVFARNEQGKVVHLWWDGTKFTDFAKLGDQDAGGDPFGWTRADDSGEVYVHQRRRPAHEERSRRVGRLVELDLDRERSVLHLRQAHRGERLRRRRAGRRQPSPRRLEQRRWQPELGRRAAREAAPTATRRATTAPARAASASRAATGRPGCSSALRCCR